MNAILETPKRSILSSVRSFTLLLFLVVIALSSFGQGITGSITGTVTDTSGAPIAGATVEIRQVGTDATRTILTSDVDSSGVVRSRSFYCASELHLWNLWQQHAVGTALSELGHEPDEKHHLEGKV
jgi:hypothetical protein